VARLILLNGPPGVGKSTLARRWVAEQTTAVVVEVDALRTSLDGWANDDASKLEARRMAIEVADAHLRAGFDVMVPQYLGRPDFIERLERTAITAAAAFVEVHLLATVDEVVARFETRRSDLGDAAHPQQEVGDVRAAVTDALGRLELGASTRRLVATISATGDLDATLDELRALLDQS
jgi:predicted kinase